MREIVKWSRGSDVSLVTLQPPIFGAYLYDAVYQYAVALNKTIARGQAVTGETVAKKLRDIQYESELVEVRVVRLSWSDCGQKVGDQGPVEVTVARK